MREIEFLEQNKDRIYPGEQNASLGCFYLKLYHNCKKMVRNQENDNLNL